MKIRLKNVTGSQLNKGLLDEIAKDTGLKEGAIIENAIYEPSNKSCHFTVFNVINVDCVAWLGETCEEVK